MIDLNTALRVNPEARSNTDIQDLTSEFRRRDNAAFLAKVAEQLRQASQPEGPGGTRIHAGGMACIGLLGEYGLIGYSSRRAQEILRLDRTPSYWSHAFLLVGALSEDAAVNRSARQSAWIWESCLEPPGAFNYFSYRNGISARRISDYALATFDFSAAHCVPNMAIIAIGLTEAERQAILERANNPDVDQLRYDLAGLLGLWHAYITTRAGEPNPLLQGHALFASAYVQFAYDAAGVDLAPGAHQRNTAPEHIWQAVRYLTPTFRIHDATQATPVQRTVLGWTCIRERACVQVPVETQLPRRLSELTGQTLP